MYNLQCAFMSILQAASAEAIVVVIDAVVVPCFET